MVPPRLGRQGTRNEMPQHHRIEVLESPHVDEFAVGPEDGAEPGVAEPQRVRRDGLEDRLHIDGDRLITRRISLVAVCCSSASCVARNSRTFSMAIAA